MTFLQIYVHVPIHTKKTPPLPTSGENHRAATKDVTTITLTSKSNLVKVTIEVEPSPSSRLKT